MTIEMPKICTNMEQHFPYTRKIKPRDLARELVNRTGFTDQSCSYYAKNMGRIFNVINGNMNGEFHEDDIDDIRNFCLLKHRFLGISREHPKSEFGRVNTALREEYFETLNMFGRKKGFNSEGRILFIVACRDLLAPYNDAEIESKFMINSDKIRQLFSDNAFMAFIGEMKLKLGFVGSIAYGAFRAFSDVDIGWDYTTTNSPAFDSVILNEFGRKSGVDLIMYTKGTHVKWLSKRDIRDFKYMPNHLFSYYRAHHMHNSFVRWIKSHIDGGQDLHEIFA
jgi:hypothetical protein